MTSLTKRLLGLAGTAMAFAGMSFGQYTCTTNVPQASPILDRFEDTTALVAALTISCTSTAATANGTMTVTMNEPVTSQPLTIGTSALSEAVMIITDTGANNSVTAGAISGNTITFTGVLFPGDNFTITIENVRVNASLAPNATSNFAITESVFASNLGVQLFATTAPQTVGVVVQGFSVPSLPAPLKVTFGVTAPPGSNPVNYATCTANPLNTAPVTGSFAIAIGENFGGAFKAQTPTTGQANCGANPCTVTNGEQGQYQGGVAAAPIPLPVAANVTGLGKATHGTRIQLAFANIPAGVTLYVPTVIINGTLTATLTQTAAGALKAVTANGPTSNSNVPATDWAVAGNAAIYEITATDNTVANEGFTVLGYAIAAPNFVTTTVPAITVTVGPAPTTGTDIPTFATTSNPPLTLSLFNLCQTTLLFPFAAGSAASGYDTGIAISNTGLDPYTKALTAAGTPGTCTFNFYGSGAPTPSTNVTLPTTAFPATLNPGQTAAFSIVANNVAPGFSGYIIAQCNFLYGHGLGLITYGAGANSGYSEGYIAEVLGNNRSATAVGAGPEAITF